MSARVWWKPWTWLRQPETPEGVRNLSDLFDRELFAENPLKARLEAALLAQRAGLVFAPGALDAEDVETLARARELLELERLGSLESVLRDFADVIRGTDVVEDAEDTRALLGTGGL